MSGEATGYVWRESPYTGATFIVHLAIADVVNDLHDNEFWMSVKALATKARVGRATAIRALAQLVTDGYLIKLTDGHAKGTTVRYSFEMDGRGGITMRPPGGITMSPQRSHHEPREVSPRDLPSLLPRKENANLTAAFGEFYDQAYPRKAHRASALAAFKAAVKAGVDPEAIVDGARRFRDDPNLPTGREAGFVPYPATWIRAEGWLDNPLPPRVQPKRRAGQITEDSIRAVLDREQAEP